MTNVDPSGLNWTQEDPSGPKGTQVDQLGPKWTKADQNGPQWTSGPKCDGASLPPSPKDQTISETNMVATMAAVTRPPDCQDGRKLSISPYLLDKDATWAAARGICVIQNVHKTASVILYPSPEPGTAKKLADRSNLETRKAVAV